MQCPLSELPLLWDTVPAYFRAMHSGVRPSCKGRRPVGLDLLTYLTAKQMTPEQRRFESAYVGALREAEAYGIPRDRIAALAHAWATGVLAYYGYTEPQRPDITSGYRDPAKQRNLLERWNRGERAGFIGKPACRSQHTIRNAIDVQTDVDGFEPYAYLLVTYTGATDGSTFNDQGHFDWRNTTAEVPPNICDIDLI